MSIDMGSMLCDEMVSELGRLYTTFKSTCVNPASILYDNMYTTLNSMSEGKTLPDNDKVKNIAEELLLLGNSIETNGLKLGTAYEDGYILGMGALGIDMDENGTITSLPDTIIDNILSKFDEVIKTNTSAAYANFISYYSQLLHLFDVHSFEKMLVLTSTVKEKCSLKTGYPTISDIQTKLKEFNMDDSGEIDLVSVINNTELFNSDNALAARQLELGYFYARNAMLTTIGKDSDGYLALKRIKENNSYNYLSI